MKYFTIFFLVYFTNSFIAKSQKGIPYFQKDLTYNERTGLVSISNVILLSDTTISNLDIYKLAKQFFILNHTTEPNIYYHRFLRKKFENDIPNFYGGIGPFEDSLFLSKITFSISDGLGILKTSADRIGANFFVFIKKGRIKYEITNIIHSNPFAKGSGGFEGGKFENEKPVFSDRLFTQQKDNWESLKKSVFRMLLNIAREFEKAYKNNKKDKESNFNF